jgi:hypothetical protein
MALRIRCPIRLVRLPFRVQLHHRLHRFYRFLGL